MTMNFKRIIYSVLFIWPCLSLSTGQEFTNQVVRAYKISNETSVDVFNKYGKIHVISWEQDSVKFIIDIKIKNNAHNANCFIVALVPAFGISYLRFFRMRLVLTCLIL